MPPDFEKHLADTDLLQYLVDAYLMFAASAIAANTFLRSLAGAGFPLFATYVSQICPAGVDGMKII